MQMNKMEFSLQQAATSGTRGDLLIPHNLRHRSYLYVSIIHATSSDLSSSFHSSCCIPLTGEEMVCMYLAAASVLRANHAEQRNQALVTSLLLRQ